MNHGVEATLSRKQCAYCGRPATTQDHIPPRKLFPKPRPTRLITVPSCKDCNNRLSVEEEYFVHVLLSAAEADTSAAQQLREQRFRGTPTARQIRMARRMVGHMHLEEIRTDAGLYLGVGTNLNIERVPFDKVVEKITYGLYFAEFGRRCPCGCGADVVLKPPREFFDHPDIAVIIGGSRGRSVGGDTFAYTIAHAIELPGLVFCCMWFFGTIPVVCTLRPIRAPIQ